MSAKHTPGPWVVIEREDEANCYSLVQPSEHWLAAIRFNGELMPAVQAATACLIGAGPDMLAALKAVEWSAERRVEKHPVSCCPVCRGEFSIGHEDDCAIDAAIAKAEGRE